MPLEFLALAGVVGVVVALGWAGERRVGRQLARWAEPRGWKLQRGDPDDLPVRWRRLWIMSQGHHRRAFDVIRGPVPGGEIFLFEYACERGLGRGRTTDVMTVAAIRQSRPVLPMLVVDPRRFEPVGCFAGCRRLARDDAEPAALAVFSEHPMQVGAARAAEALAVARAAPPGAVHQAGGSVTVVAVPGPADPARLDGLLACLDRWRQCCGGSRPGSS